jgi:hypothetical protein
MNRYKSPLALPQVQRGDFMRRRQLQSLCVLTALAVLCVQLTLFSATPKEYAFYVSPDGDDGASGTGLVRAFATIQRARDAIRELKKTKAVLKDTRLCQANPPRRT